MLFFYLISLSLSASPELESACSFQVVSFMLSQAEHVHYLFKDKQQQDELGAINQMALDSYDKCTASITEDQIKEINKSGGLPKYNNLVRFNPLDYKDKKFPPNFDFVSKLKSKQIRITEEPKSDL